MRTFRHGRPLTACSCRLLLLPARASCFFPDRRARLRVEDAVPRRRRNIYDRTGQKLDEEERLRRRRRRPCRHARKRDDAEERRRDGAPHRALGHGGRREFFARREDRHVEGDERLSVALRRRPRARNRQPLQGEIAERAASSAGALTLETISVLGELPASEFPLHSAEGVSDMALVPLVARGETLGLLVVGYRTSHRFNADEKQLLESLAEMAALALDNARLLETVSTGKKVWEQTFDAIPDGILVHDERMLIARCNREAAEMMGFDEPAEAIGVSCRPFARLFLRRAAAFHMRQGRLFLSFELRPKPARYLVSFAPLRI